MTALTLWSTAILFLNAGPDGVPDDSQVTPGPMMAVVVLSIMAATVLLWLSLRKQLGRIQVPPEGTDLETESADDDRPAGPPPLS
jgi:hypothetical protein